MTRGADLGRNIALAFASIVFAAGLCELGLRLAGGEPVAVNPDQRHFWVHHPTLGWANRPGASGVFDNGYFRVHVAINSRGLRGPEVPLARPDDVRRVVVVGDSFAWGFGVEEDETFAARLESSLPALQVINGAVSGYSNDQELLWLRDEGIRYQPQLVVASLSGNDDIMNHMGRTYWVYYKPSFWLDARGRLVLQGVPVPLASPSERLRHALRSRSALARVIESAVLGHEADYVNPSRDLPDPEDPHRLTLALLEAMSAAARRQGADFLIVANSQFWFSPSGSYERLLAELRAVGLDVVDVEALPGWEPEAMQILGDGHWNARGHDFVARALAAEVGARLPTPP